MATTIMNTFGDILAKLSSNGAGDDDFVSSELVNAFLGNLNTRPNAVVDWNVSSRDDSGTGDGGTRIAAVAKNESPGGETDHHHSHANGRRDGSVVTSECPGILLEEPSANSSGDATHQVQPADPLLPCPSKTPPTEPRHSKNGEYSTKQDVWLTDRCKSKPPKENGDATPHAGGGGHRESANRTDAKEKTTDLRHKIKGRQQSVHDRSTDRTHQSRPSTHHRADRDHRTKRHSKQPPSPSKHPQSLRRSARRSRSPSKQHRDPEALHHTSTRSRDPGGSEHKRKRRSLSPRTRSRRRHSRNSERRHDDRNTSRTPSHSLLYSGLKKTRHSSPGSHTSSPVTIASLSTNNDLSSVASDCTLGSLDDFVHLDYDFEDSMRSCDSHDRASSLEDGEICSLSGSPTNPPASADVEVDDKKLAPSLQSSTEACSSLEDAETVSLFSISDSEEELGDEEELGVRCDGSQVSAKVECSPIGLVPDSESSHNADNASSCNPVHSLRNDDVMVSSIEAECATANLSSMPHPPPSYNSILPARSLHDDPVMVSSIEAECAAANLSHSSPTVSKERIFYNNLSQPAAAAAVGTSQPTSTASSDLSFSTSQQTSTVCSDIGLLHDSATCSLTDHELYDWTSNPATPECPSLTYHSTYDSPETPRPMTPDTTPRALLDCSSPGTPRPMTPDTPPHAPRDCSSPGTPRPMTPPRSLLALYDCSSPGTPNTLRHALLAPYDCNFPGTPLHRNLYSHERTTAPEDSTKTPLPERTTTPEDSTKPSAPGRTTAPEVSTKTPLPNAPENIVPSGPGTPVHSTFGTPMGPEQFTSSPPTTPNHSSSWNPLSNTTEISEHISSEQTPLPSAPETSPGTPLSSPPETILSAVDPLPSSPGTPNRTSSETTSSRTPPCNGGLELDTEQEEGEITDSSSEDEPSQDIIQVRAPSPSPEEVAEGWEPTDQEANTYEVVDAIHSRREATSHREHSDNREQKIQHSRHSTGRGDVHHRLGLSERERVHLQDRGGKGPSRHLQDRGERMPSRHLQDRGREGERIPSRHLQDRGERISSSRHSGERDTRHEHRSRLREHSKSPLYLSRSEHYSDHQKHHPHYRTRSRSRSRTRK